MSNRALNAIRNESNLYAKQLRELEKNYRYALAAAHSQNEKIKVFRNRYRVNSWTPNEVRLAKRATTLGGNAGLNIANKSGMRKNVINAVKNAISQNNERRRVAPLNRIYRNALRTATTKPQKYQAFRNRYRVNSWTSNNAKFAQRATTLGGNAGLNMAYKSGMRKNVINAIKNAISQGLVLTV
jgi:undecaprenyl pyrophosphate synthase